MRSGLKLAVALRMLVAAASLTAGGARGDDAATAPAGTLMAAAAWGQVVGNTIVGTTPDGTYTAFVAGDGSIRQVDQDGKATGTWSLKGDTVCIAMPDEDEDDCRSVTVTGRTGAFTDSAGSRYPFEILPGNAKDL